MPNDELSDHVDLFRIIWSPDDVQNGQVQPAAFPKNDLKNLERTLSVDRLDKLVPAVVRQTADDQKQKPSQTGKAREVAYCTLLNTGRVRQYRDDDSVTPFLGEPDPIFIAETGFDNPAHCKLGNASGKTTRGYLLQLQTTLADLAFATRLLDSALHEIEAEK